MIKKWSTFYGPSLRRHLEQNPRFLNGMAFEEASKLPLKLMASFGSSAKSQDIFPGDERFGRYLLKGSPEHEVFKKAFEHAQRMELYLTIAGSDLIAEVRLYWKKNKEPVYFLKCKLSVDWIGTVRKAMSQHNFKGS
jgi:hypothetical protein